MLDRVLGASFAGRKCVGYHGDTPFDAAREYPLLWRWLSAERATAMEKTMNYASTAQVARRRGISDVSELTVRQLRAVLDDRKKSTDDLSCREFPPQPPTN